MSAHLLLQLNLKFLFGKKIRINNLSPVDPRNPKADPRDPEGLKEHNILVHLLFCFV